MLVVDAMNGSMSLSRDKLFGVAGDSGQDGCSVVAFDIINVCTDLFVVFRWFRRST